MADTDQAKRDADKKEAERQAEQKRLQEQQHQVARQGQGGEPSTQADNDKRAAKQAEARASLASEYYNSPETPVPTQAEMDAAMLGVMGQQELPEGSGMYKTPLQLEDQQRRKLESDKSGGYQTRSTRSE